MLLFGNLKALLVETTESLLGSRQVSSGWPVDIRGPIPIPSNLANVAIFCTCILKIDYAYVDLRLFHLQSPFLSLSASLPHNIQNHIFR